MKDVNGIELKVGDIVKISNGFFKCDNGLYFIENENEGVLWLHEINETGKVCITPYSQKTYPLESHVMNYEKRKLSYEWNIRKAVIRKVTDIETKYVVDYFRKIRSVCLNDLVWCRLFDYGKSWTDPLEKRIHFCADVIAYIEEKTKEGEKAC